MTDLIGQLLRVNMLQQLGDDEFRVQRIRQAAKNLAAELISTKRGQVPAAVFYAVDCNTHAGAPMMDLPREELFEVWETFGQAFPDEPTELYRAVLLAAVEGACSADRRVAAAAWYALRTGVEELPTGRWEPVLTQLMTKWDADIGARVEQAWAIVTPSVGEVDAILSMAEPDEEQPETESNSTTNHPDEDVAESTQGLPEAEPTSSESSRPGQRHTSFWRRSGFPTIASTDGAGRAAEPEFASAAMARARNIINVSGNNYNTFSSNLMQQFLTLMEELTGDIQKAAAVDAERYASYFEELSGFLSFEISRARKAEHRAELLWWRSTGYSSERRCLYRELTAEQAVISAALDMHRITTWVAPVSVEHILNDTVAAATKGKVSLTSLTNCELASELVAGREPGTGTLMNAITQGDHTPLSLTTSWLPGRAAVLLFRDLQCARLLSSASLS